MIRHIVLFQIKDEYKDEIPELVKNFYGMKGRIEGPGQHQAAGQGRQHDRTGYHRGVRGGSFRA